MADDLSKRGEPDRLRINMHETWEVAYNTKKYGITKEVLQKAVGAAGVMRANVESWLRRNGHIK